MAKFNLNKMMLLRALAAIFIVCGLILYLHFNAEYKQSRREFEYMQAHQRVAEQKRQRTLAYEKRMQQEKLRREYNQGRVVGLAPDTSLP